MKYSTLSTVHMSHCKVPFLVRAGIAAIGVWLLSHYSAQAANKTWVGTTGTNWSTGGWSTAAPTNGDSIVFGTVLSGSSTSLNNDISSLSLAGITFNAGASAWTLGGNSLTLGSGGINASAMTSGTVTINNALTLAAGYQSWTVGSGGHLAVNGAVTRNTGAAVNFSTTGITSTSLANDSTGILGGWATVGNSGTSGATADWAANDGSGNIVTYSGYTAISSGSSTSQALSAATASQNWKTSSGANGYATTLTNSGTINSLVVQGDFIIGAGNTLTLGSGGLILSGVSRWIKGPNGTTSDTAQLTSGLASGELFVDVSDAQSDASNWKIWAKIVDNGGTAVSVVKNGPGLLELANTNTYTGNTYLNAGSLAAGITNAFGTTGTLYLNGGTLTNGGAGAQVNLPNNIVVSGTNAIQIAKNGTAQDFQLTGTMSGSGSLTLGNDNDNNFLYLGVTNTMTSGTITLANNTNAMRFTSASAGNANVAWVFNNTTSGKESLDFTGGTISFGSMTGAGIIGGNVTSGAIIISAGALGLNDTFSGSIRDSVGNTGETVGLTKVGTGTMTLSGINTYTGGTTVNNGALTLANGGGAGAILGTLTINAGAVVNLTAANALGYTAGTQVTTININGGTLNNATNNNNGFLTNIVLTGGTLAETVATTGINGINFSTGYGITTNAGSGQSTISARLVIRGGPLVFNVADDAAATDLLVSGVILSTADGTGITKTGAGTMVLTGSNTYTGNTGVQQGTLVLGTGGSLSGSSTLTLGGASSTSGVFQLGDASGAVNATVTSLTTAAGAGTANAVVGGNAAVSTLTVNNSGTVSYGGLLGGVGTNQNNLALIKSGTGTLTLSGINTYNGGTTVNGGALTLANGGSAGAIRGTLTINAGAVVNLTAGDALGYTSGSQVTTVNINGGTLNNAINANNGFLTNFVLTGGTLAETVATTGVYGINFSGASGITTNASSATSTVSSRIVARGGSMGFAVADGAAANDLVVSGVILSTAAGGITKTGAGTMVLSASNTYTGATIVKAGTLIVSGSLSGSSAVTVGDSANLGTSAILAGSGVVGNVTAGAASSNTGAVIDPGNSAGVAGILSTGSLTVQNGAHLAMQIGGTTAGGEVSTGYDQVVASSTVTLAGGDLKLTLNGSPTFSGSDVLYLIVNNSGLAVASQFTSVTLNGLAVSDTNNIVLNGQRFALVYNANFAGTGSDGIANDVALQAIPEPSTWVMMIGGMGMLVWSQRARRRMAK